MNSDSPGPSLHELEALEQDPRDGDELEPAINGARRSWDLGFLDLFPNRIRL